MTLQEALPQEYALRAGRPGDEEVVAALLAVVDADEDAPPTLSVEDVEQDWRRAGFDPARDTRLVWTSEGELAAYCELRALRNSEWESYVIVHPDQRGRGLGSALLTWTEESVASADIADAEERVLRHFTTSLDEAAHELLARRGYEVVRYFWHMEIDMAGAPRARALEGIDIRPFDPVEARDLHALIDEAFAESWGWEGESFEEWWATFSSRRDFDPGLSFVASEGDDLVGALTAYVKIDRGWIGDLAVIESHRGRSIGAALLTASFREFYRRGLRTVGLNVDAANPTGATRLYERVGMRVIREFWVHEKAISVPASERSLLRTRFPP